MPGVWTRVAKYAVIVAVSWVAAWWGGQHWALQVAYAGVCGVTLGGAYLLRELWRVARRR